MFHSLRQLLDWKTFPSQPSHSAETSLHAFIQQMVYDKVLLSLQQAFILLLPSQKIPATATKDVRGSTSAIVLHLVETTHQSNRGGWGFFLYIFSPGGRSRLHSLPSSIFTAHATCISSMVGYKYKLAGADRHKLQVGNQELHPGTRHEFLTGSPLAHCTRSPWRWSVHYAAESWLQTLTCCTSRRIQFLLPVGISYAFRTQKQKEQQKFSPFLQTPLM